MNDLRFACRELLKHPGFTAVAVLTLALGIGANTAIFSLLDAVLLRMLPVSHPDELRALNHSGGDRSGNGFAYPVFERLREENPVFTELFAFSTWPEITASIRGQDEPLPGGVLLVSGEYCSGLGIKPLLGRLITSEDNRTPGGHPVAVLSHRFWQHRFGGDPSVVGQTIALNGTPYSVIGVTPLEFFGVRVGRSDAVTIPLMMHGRMMPGTPYLQDQKHWDVEVMGRLKPGRSEAEAAAALKVVFQRIDLEMEGGQPSPERLNIIQDRRIDLAPASKGLSSLRERFSRPLHVLMVVAGLVLLIACANVANLLLARAVARQKEMAVRLALGAGRRRVARQLLTESVLLALLGGAAGLLFAKWVGALCVALIPGRFGAVALNLSLDARVLSFTLIVSAFTVIVFGLLPAWQVARLDLTPTLKEGTRALGPGRWRAGMGLVSAQVALSFVLLIGAGLFVVTFQNIRTHDPGFDDRNVLLFSLDSRMRAGPADQGTQLFRQLLERIESVPGVVSATVSRDGNFGGGGRTSTDLTVDRDDGPSPANQSVLDVPTGPRFFETFGVALLQGRDFTFQDDDRTPKVAILNLAAARHFFGNQSPVGQSIGVGAPGDTVVIGVVGDTKLNDFREEPSRVMYRPFLQTGLPRRMTFAVRTAVTPLSLLTALRREIDAYERNLPLFEFTTLEAVIGKSLAQERLFAALSNLFGLLALTLAAVGLYGVMAHSVSRRTREVGLRMALGPGRRSVLGLIVGQEVKVALRGLLAGLLAAFGATRLIASQLYGITATDPLIFVAVTALLATVALLACWLPAHRASRVARRSDGGAAMRMTRTRNSQPRNSEC